MALRLLWLLEGPSFFASAEGRLSRVDIVSLTVRRWCISGGKMLGREEGREEERGAHYHTAIIHQGEIHVCMCACQNSYVDGRGGLPRSKGKELRLGCRAERGEVKCAHPRVQPHPHM